MYNTHLTAINNTLHISFKVDVFMAMLLVLKKNVEVDVRANQIQ